MTKGKPKGPGDAPLAKGSGLPGLIPATKRGISSSDMTLPADLPGEFASVAHTEFGLVSHGDRFGASIAIILAAEGALEDQAAQLLTRSEAQLMPPPQYRRRRHDILAGRLVAKRAIRGLAPAVHLQGVEILRGVLGQPIVSGDGLANIGVTITHDGSVALAVAFHEACPLGIDIEEIDNSHRQALKQSVSGAELAAMSRILKDNDLAAFTSIWCAKEALSKLLRSGLSAAPETLAIRSARWTETCIEVDFNGFIGYRAMVLSGHRRCMALAVPPSITLEDAGARWTAMMKERLDAEPPATNHGTEYDAFASTN